MSSSKRAKTHSSGNVLVESPEGILLKVKVVPAAKKSEIAGKLPGCIKIRLQAPPVEGKANRELLKFLARALGLKKNMVSLISGEKSREKTVLLSRISLKEAGQRLTTALGEE